MSRRDSHDDDAPEREQIYPREMPLPTYEEVIGTPAPHVGFKSNVLLGPLASGQQQFPSNVNSRDLGRRGSGTFYAPKHTSCTKGIIFVLISIMLVPIFILIAVLKSHACSPPVPPDLDNLYVACVDQKAELAKQIDVVGNPDKVRKSVEEYEDSLREKDLLEASLQKLRDEIIALTEQKEKLMTTTSTTTIAPTPQRKRTKQEQLDELFDINSGAETNFSNMIRRAQEIINSKD